jgi:hypothetical protein
MAKQVRLWSDVDVCCCCCISHPFSLEIRCELPELVDALAITDFIASITECTPTRRGTGNNAFTQESIRDSLLA